MKPIKEFFLSSLLSLIPFFWALICIFFNLMDINFLPKYHQSFPVILIVIFYFAVFSPQKLNIFFVFFLGLIADLLTTGPFGLHSFIFSLMFFIPNLFRSYIHILPFFKLWAVFCAVFLVLDIVWAWFFRMASGIWVSASFWFVQFVFTCLLYPLFMGITGYLMKRIRIFR